MEQPGCTREPGHAVMPSRQEKGHPPPDRRHAEGPGRIPASGSMVLTLSRPGGPSVREARVAPLEAEEARVAPDTNGTGHHFDSSSNPLLYPRLLV